MTVIITILIFLIIGGNALFFTEGETEVRKGLVPRSGPQGHRLLEWQKQDPRYSWRCEGTARVFGQNTKGGSYLHKRPPPVGLSRSNQKQLTSASPVGHWTQAAEEFGGGEFPHASHYFLMEDRF